MSDPICVDDIKPDSQDNDIRWFFRKMKLRYESLTPEEREANRKWVDDMRQQSTGDPPQEIDVKAILKMWAKRSKAKHAEV